MNPSIENMTQTNVSTDLGNLEPEKSRTYEVGAKWDGFDGRLLVNELAPRLQDRLQDVSMPPSTVSWIGE